MYDSKATNQKDANQNNGRNTSNGAQPDLSQTFLPDYRPRGNNTTAPPASPYANLPQANEYANIPSANQYANIPAAQQGAKNQNPYGTIIPANNVEHNGAEQQAPQQRARRPLPPLPKHDVYTGDGVDRIVTETNDRKNPQTDNVRSTRKLGDFEHFTGHIVMEKANHVMLMRSAQPGPNGQETLVHLPPSASTQLRADTFANKRVEQSIQNGSQGKPLDLYYEKGQWSVAHQSPDHKLGKK